MGIIYIMRNVLAAIISKAMTDWCNNAEMRDEIREFFTSEWGIEICDMLELSAKEILRKLENGEINTQGLDEEAA